MPKKFTEERKNSDAKPIIFLEGVQFTVCPIIIISKKHPSKDRNENSLHLGYQLIGLFVRCSFCVLITFPSVVCFRCRERPLYRRERGKVFGLNTLRRRKIQFEAACHLAYSYKICIIIIDSNENIL